MALVTLVPAGEGTCSPAMCTGAAQAAPPQAPLHPCQGDSPQLQNCVSVDFSSGVFLQSWLVGLLVYLLVLQAPSPSEHLPFSNTKLRSLQIQLLQLLSMASDLLPLHCLES